MKSAFQILICILLLSCKSNQTKNNLEYTSINKESISEFKNELEIFTRISELRKKKLDFIAYKNYSIGSKSIIYTNDTNNCSNCSDYYSTYLIWEENEIDYIQIFDNCGNFYPVQIQNKSILKFMKENFETFRNERVKFYQTDKTSILTISHSTYKEFLFSLNDEEIYNYFDTYNLESSTERVNINYLHNQNLKLIQLNNMIEAEIKNQNNLNTFKRDLTQCR